MKIVTGQHDYMLFDGDCGICNLCAQHARRMAQNEKWQIHPYQSYPESELEDFGVTHAQCAKQLHVISRRGKVHRGAFALNYFLMRRLPWSLLIVLIYAFPLLLLFEIIGYALVARFRQRLSNRLGLTACRFATEPEIIASSKRDRQRFD